MNKSKKDTTKHINTNTVEYQFFYNSERKPIVTVAYFQEDGRTFRGIAVCSELDNPCKKTGKKIALDRVRYAYYLLHIGRVGCDLGTRKSNYIRIKETDILLKNEIPYIFKSTSYRTAFDEKFSRKGATP